MSKNGSGDYEKVATEGTLYGRSIQSEPFGGGRTCHDCRTVSPETETSYTLISSRYGWRLELVPDKATGQKVSIWRCPDCWRNRKGSRPSASKAPMK